jgi:ABC-2 type transport system ATP-binding protein
VIELDRFSKRYGDRAAVEELSFTVAPGDILGLVGPNGAGKTTTLRAIAGVLRPGGGTIRVGGFDVVKEPRQAKRELALVPDTPNPYELLTVREHLEFARLAYGAAKDGRDPDELLAKFELDDKRDELCGSLSRGMRQKLAICCALVHRPKALLLDEPLTGLDPMGIRRMKATIAARAQRGAAVILSSHLLPLVEELCSKVLIIQHGRIVALGSMAEIAAERPELAGRGLEDLFLALTDSPHSER